MDPPQLQVLFLFLSVPSSLPFGTGKHGICARYPSLAAVTGCDVEAPPEQPGSQLATSSLAAMTWDGREPESHAGAGGDQVGSATISALSDFSRQLPRSQSLPPGEWDVRSCSSLPSLPPSTPNTHGTCVETWSPRLPPPRHPYILVASLAPSYHSVRCLSSSLALSVASLWTYPFRQRPERHVQMRWASLRVEAN